MKKVIAKLFHNQYIIYIAIILIVAIVLGRCHPVRVSGYSMSPTYKDGEVIWQNALVDNKTTIPRGSVVVFKHSSRFLIKRAVGIPGDTVEIRNGILYVNDEESPYRYEDIESAGCASVPVTLGNNKYFCMGDNRNASVDSRCFGPVDRKDIKYIITSSADKQDENKKPHKDSGK